MSSPTMRSLCMCTPGGARNSPTLRGFVGSLTSCTVKPSGPLKLAPPTRGRATRAFLIALIAAVGINFGAMLGLVGWGVLQAFGVFGEPAIEKVQRAHGASIAQIEASVEALNASVTGLSAHFNAAGEREDAANRRVAEIGEALGVLRSG